MMFAIGITEDLPHARSDVANNDRSLNRGRILMSSKESSEYTGCIYFVSV